MLNQVQHDKRQCSEMPKRARHDGVGTHSSQQHVTLNLFQGLSTLSAVTLDTVLNPVLSPWETTKKIFSSK